MDTLIRAAEVWTPTPDGTLLEFSSGWFGAAHAFGISSRRLCFGRDEGLPGRAWEQGHPILLPRFEGTAFRRTAAAHAAGLRSAVALPAFRAGRLQSVVVLFCGDPAANDGTLELWHNDPRVTGDLTLAEGRFATPEAELEPLSRDAFLPRGSGLPGLAWQRGAAVFADDLAGDPRFLRAQAAAAAGFVHGLALPCPSRDRRSWVLGMLTPPGTPIAMRVESWVPDERGALLRRGFGHCVHLGNLSGDGLQIAASAEGGPIGAAYAECRASVQPIDRAHGAPPLAAAADGAGHVLALPITADDDVSEVIALYF